MRMLPAAALIPALALMGGLALAQTNAPAQQPPPAHAPAPGPAPRQGLLFLPYFGIESHRGKSSTNVGVGLQLGALVGGRVNPRLSMNLELTIDILNPKNVPSGADVTLFEGDATLSPLIHVPLAVGEVVVGPRLGVFGSTQQTPGSKITARGFAFGLNAGAFFPVSAGLSVGGMLAFTIRNPQQVCTTIGNGIENCDSDTDFNSEKIIAASLGLLF